MSRKASDQISLFDGVPQDFDKTQEGNVVYRPRSKSKVEQILDQLDWSRYEEDVFVAAQQSVHQFLATVVSQNEHLFVTQVSLYTDPQIGETSVCFNCSQSTAPSNKNYCKNPADFTYRDFYTVAHEELASIGEQCLASRHSEQIMEKRLGQSLNEVRERLFARRILCVLPLANPSYMGISSHRDWYDYETQIPCE